MTRKECIDYIKSNGYRDEATKLARKCAGHASANYTNLSTPALIEFVETKEKTKNPAAKSDVKKASSKCSDEAARKAIIAIAELIGYKNIKKFFI